MKNQDITNADGIDLLTETNKAKIARLKKQRACVLKWSHLPDYSRFNLAASIGAEIDDLMKEALIR